MKVGDKTRYFRYQFKDSDFQEIDSSTAREFVKKGYYLEECVFPPVATLILHVTRRCPLQCKHCYLSASPFCDEKELSLDEIKGILRQFKAMGGLGVDVTGGDPLTRTDVQEILKYASQLKLHVDLLTSGLLIKSSLLQELKPFVHKITLSIDGLERDHDWIRGAGNFSRILRTIELISQSEIPFALTTLVTYRNLSTLPEIAEMVCKLGASKWSLTLPRLTGRMKSNPDIFYRTIKEYQRDWKKIENLLQTIYEITSSYNVQVLVDFPLLPPSFFEEPETEQEEDKAGAYSDLYVRNRICWDSTITIFPEGNIVPCLFFPHLSYGNIRNSSLKDLYFSLPRSLLLQRFKKISGSGCLHVYSTLKGGEKDEKVQKEELYSV
jgi:MoaA/NifB/PqqE/SkfB family radical SAM enzyme